MSSSLEVIDHVKYRCQAWHFLVVDCEKVDAKQNAGYQRDHLHGLPPSVQFLRLNVTDSRYYCLGEFIDSAWLWQARVPESELDRLAERFKLRPVDRSEIPDQFRSMPRYWWHPSVTEGTRVLSTPSFPLDERGPDGWHALATWNPDDQVLHVWIKNNF